MSNKTKSIEMDLFKPFYFQKDKDGVAKECAYDLSALFKHISEKPLTETKRKIFGDNQMFHKCKYIKGKDIWELQILHLREQILPGIADEGGAYELIQLDENQYPAESTTVIYDVSKNILYVQRNVYGTSIRALTALIQLISPEGIWVDLKPVMSDSKMAKIKKSSFYRKIILTVDSEQMTEKEHGTKLGRIIASISEYNGKMVTVNMGFGRKRKKFLKRTDTIELLKEAYEFPGTEKLIASIAESADGKCENVDLLDDRAKIVFNLTYSREEPITHERIYDECYGKI